MENRDETPAVVGLQISNVLEKAWRYVGRVEYQHIWESLHKAALAGMVANGQPRVRENGEAVAAAWVLSKEPEREDKTRLVVDCGACKGEWSDAALAHMRREGIPHEMILFDPSGHNYDILQKKYSTNDNVEVYQMGLLDRETKMDLYANEPGSPLGSVFDRDIQEEYGWDMHLSIQRDCKFTRLAQFCEDSGIKHIDLLKIDAEGADLLVLKGAGDMLEKGQISAIQFEFGDSARDAHIYFKDFYNYLEKWYSLLRVVYDGMSSLGKYSSFMEIYTGFNVMCLLKPLDWVKKDD